MSGFIALTTCEWIESLNHINSLDTMVFWRKRKSFKAIKPNEFIYFLKRGPFASNRDRFIIGRGTFIGTDLLLANEAWSKYGKFLGYNDKQSCIRAVQSTYHESNPELGCLLIHEITVYKTPVSLEQTGIDFSPYIVSGKTISDKECIAIDSAQQEE